MLAAGGVVSLLLPRPSGKKEDCRGANELTVWGSVWLNGSRCRGAPVEVTSSETLPLSQACGKGGGSGTPAEAGGVSGGSGAGTLSRRPEAWTGATAGTGSETLTGGTGLERARGGVGGGARVFLRWKVSPGGYTRRGQTLFPGRNRGMACCPFTVNLGVQS